VAELKILEAMPEGIWVSSGWLSAKVWPAKFRSIGHRRGKWQRMGAMLYKMWNKGLVHRRITDTNQKQWLRAKPTPNARTEPRLPETGMAKRKDKQ